MKRVPLYKTHPTIVRGPNPLPHDKSCTLCLLHASTKNVCLRPEGDPAGLLVVGEWPTRVEEASGRPFSSPAMATVRRVIQGAWSGKIAFDVAVRCAPGGAEVKDKHIEACRPYTATVLDDVQPTRIFAFGNAAASSVLGRKVSVWNARRGYGWINIDGADVPVFFFLPPAIALRNHFVRREFESDIRWAATFSPEMNLSRMSTQLVESAADALKARDELLADQPVTYDVETVGRMSNPDFRIEALTALGWKSMESWTWTRATLKDPECVRHLRAVLEKAKIGAQNGKYDDRAVLVYLDADVKHVDFDTRLFRKMLDNDSSGALDSIAELVGMGGHKNEAHTAIKEICSELKYQAKLPASGLTPTGRRRTVRAPAFHVDPLTLQQVSNGVEPIAFAYGFLAEDILYRYNARDVFSTRDAARLLKRSLRATPSLERVWRLISRNASRALKWIEHWGFGIDKSALLHFVDYCRTRKTESLLQLQSYAGKTDFNPASMIQLREFLFSTLGMRAIKLTDSGLQSTDKEVLDELKGKHPAVDSLLVYRRFAKLDGTYGEGMLPHIQMDGRIHPTYLIDGTGTGRLSCMNPNMQNAPRAKGNPEGKMFRDCFIAERGYVLIEADQSQIELRTAAMLSGDREMIADYVKGIDIHANNARLCCTVAWGIPLAKWDQMTKDERDPYRSKIKTATFGRLYGKTIRGLAAEFGCSIEEVEKIDKAIWGRYKRLAAWTDECVRASRKSGETWTWWAGEQARLRRIHKIADQEKTIREHAERTAYNTVVQGTAADFTTASLWPLVEWILTEGVPARVIGTIHDSILVEAHKTVASEVRDKMREIMTSHPSKGVPLVADFKEGEQWGSMEEVKPPSKKV